MKRQFCMMANRSGSTSLLAIGSLLAVVILVGAVSYLTMGSGDRDSAAVITHVVERGTFVHEVVERGEIESSRNTEIRCEVKGRNSDGTAILEVVDEGTRVQEGEILVKLDSSALEQELIEQQIACNNSESLMIQARNTLEAAEIAKKEYIEGTFKQECQTIEGEIAVAEENLRRAQQYLKYSESLAAKGYVTDLQLEGDRFAVEKALNELAAAETKLKVLQEYTMPKMSKELDAAIESGAAMYRSEESSFRLEQERKKEIEDQIGKCIIRAPQDGQVVHANTQSSRSSGEFVVEPGSLVRERQTIIRLPDPTAMQVKAEINESRVNLIKAGMLVSIQLDALGDQYLDGEVMRVNEYPEPGSWFSSQVKEYATYIRIKNPPNQIRPGLTAEVKILVDRQPDVIVTPVQTVLEHGEEFYCISAWAPTHGRQ
ncbi:MAG: HlyD family efflux transporter periplasmic adaptor subunit [Pirellulaceae bacterium]